MGQGGYGVDQAYLWYKHDAAKFGHQIHLFAFITDDFYRMQSNRVVGYGKPTIDIENGTLMVKNVPVSRRTYNLPWFTLNTQHLRRLRTVELLERVSAKIGVVPDKTGRLSKQERNEKTREVLEKIFEDLKRINEAHASKLVLVYLAAPFEIQDNDSQEWMKWIEKEARTLDIPLINVLSTFRSLPYADVMNMFIPKGQIDYPGAAGHLTEQGNEFVARMIYEEIKHHPALSQVLSAHQGD